MLCVCNISSDSGQLSAPSTTLSAPHTSLTISPPQWLVQTKLYKVQGKTLLGKFKWLNNYIIETESEH